MQWSTKYNIFLQNLVEWNTEILKQRIPVHHWNPVHIDYMPKDRNMNYELNTGWCDISLGLGMYCVLLIYICMLQ